MTFQVKEIIIQLQDAYVNVFRKKSKVYCPDGIGINMYLDIKILNNIVIIKVFTMKGREKWLKKLNPEFLSLS